MEELFSDGPHLADYSYNIGNPELGSEIGHGVDAFLRISGRRLFVEAGAYVNHVSNFIHYRPTGELDPRFGRFPVFQAAATDALFAGAELQVRWEMARSCICGRFSTFGIAELPELVQDQGTKNCLLPDVDLPRRNCYPATAGQHHH